MGKVLVVDDDEDIRSVVADTLADSLKEDGVSLQFAFAGSAEEGLTHMASENFSLIVLDQNLPKMLGTDLLQKIRGGQSANKDAPVILLSGAIDDTIATVSECEFDDVYFCEKGISWDSLVRKSKLVLLK